MALVALAAACLKKANAPDFHVVSVDHGLRKDARREVRFVADTCKQLGLQHKILRNTASLGDSGIQQSARDLRYRLMANWCQAQKIPALIVAHHRHDQAETVLMRLARGSGIDGLSGMAAVQSLETEAGPLEIIRPFLDTDPALLARIVARAKLSWIDDPSNEDVQFERVRLRKAADMLSELGLTPAALSRAAAAMRETRDHLEAQATTWLTAHAGYHFCGFYRLDKTAFMDQSMVLQVRILRHIMSRMGPVRFAPAEHSVGYLVAAIAAQPHGAQTLGGCIVRWRSGDVMVGREAAAVTAQARMPLSGKPVIWDRRFSIKIASGKKVKSGLFAASLGAAGLRQIKQAGVQLPKGVPTCYLYVLPAIFDAHGVRDCPILSPQNRVRMTPWQPKRPYLRDMQAMAGW